VYTLDVTSNDSPHYSEPAHQDAHASFSTSLDKCRALLVCCDAEGHDFLGQIMTGDESWAKILCVTIMLTVFLEMNRIVMTFYAEGFHSKQAHIASL
jgi:hypothetical protein